MNIYRIVAAVTITAVTATGSITVAATPQWQATESDLARANRMILSDQSIVSPGRIVVVYFTPKDREPAKDHTARIRRIVEETAGFYERELERHGFPTRAMNVLRNSDGDVDVIDVVGRDTDYDKPDGRRIRDEVVPVLRERQIDAEQSVILLFCNLMDYDPVASTISHHSPYYGGGGHLSGTAWQCDSEILDPRRLTDSTALKDGEYGNITIGRHNSIFIGGVIHELGHALSLPHCRQRKDEAIRGTSLMGSGNRTYQQQMRNEGPGTFLTQTHALRLAAHPVFLKRTPQTIYDRPQTDWTELAIRTIDDHAIQIQGSVSSTIPIHAIVSYFDPAGGGDYNATTASAIPNAAGKFALKSGKLEPGRTGQLRLFACHVNGTTSKKTFNYRVDESGKPDLSSIRLALELGPMIDALQRSDIAEAKTILKRVAVSDPDLQSIGDRVLDRFKETNSPGGELPRGALWLTHLEPSIEKVGWLTPTYDRVPERPPLLSIAGDVFAKGIYAHAPARHEYALDKKWKRFTGQCGLQSGHRGSVAFQVLGNGAVLWSTKRISDGDSKSFDVDVSGVQTLTLVVTNGDDGNGGDWGVWIEPRLMDSADD